MRTLHYSGEAAAAAAGLPPLSMSVILEINDSRLFILTNCHCPTTYPTYLTNTNVLIED